MFKKIWNFFKEYKQLGFVSLSVIIGLGLDIAGYDTAAHWVLGLSAGINLVPLVWGMIQDLRSGIYGVDLLAATAILTSVLLKEYWAGIVIVLMLTGGEALEDYAQKRAKTELDALLSRAPKKAHLLRGRKEVDVAASKVRSNDKIIIKPGEVVPTDSIITEGTASFDESSLTGESLPVIKKPGNEILSGTINLDGAVIAKVTRQASDSQYQQIVALVRSAAASKSPFVRLADRYSIPFTVIAFALAISTWVISGEPVRFLEVIVVATPCPLILGAPIALISGMSRSAKHGIIIKTGAAIERLAGVKTIAFDKTGTLTKGELKVDQVVTYQGFEKSEVLSMASALEEKSVHVLANAILSEASKHKTRPGKAKNVHEIAGKGLAALVQGKHVLVGRIELMQDHSITFPKSFDKNLRQTATLVAIDNKLAGMITFKDEVRQESKQTIQRLKQLGIKHILMITGDNKATAQAIAQQIGIKEVHASALPADKLKIVEKSAQHPVAFVGDGVNDAPVLAASDVGIALGARGSTAASESADVVIMLDDLARVSDSIAIAKRTFFIARQSILLGIGISIGLMLIFSTGKFKPVYGAAIQEVVDVIVIFNALRAHSGGAILSSKRMVKH